MSKSQVNIVPQEDGATIRVSATKPDQGSIQVQTVTAEIDDFGWIREHKRSALLKGSVELLGKHVVPLIKNGKMDGRIVITEITESQLADAQYARHKKSIDSWYSKDNQNPEDDEKLDNFAKKIFNAEKTDSCNLTVNGERILRFQEFTTKDESIAPDIKIAHDNAAELAEFRAKYSNVSANLGK